MIEEIKMKINIVDLAFEMGLQPTKQGFIYSIYKEEKTRSMKLYPETNSFYCYATGHGGDVIDFYRDYHRIEVKDAVKELAVRVGLEMSVSQKSKGKGQKEEMKIKRKIKIKSKMGEQIKVLKIEKDYFEERAAVGEYMMGLEKNKAERIAMGALMDDRKATQILIYESLEKFCFGVDDEAFDYLLGKDRGLKPETIKKFRIFSIKDVKNTFEYLKDCFTDEELIISGLINKEGNFVFTYHKILIPYIENHKITYLRGRCIDTKGKFSKYIGLSNFAGNLSPKRFYNSETLRNINLGDKLIICEGEFDSMIMEQEGFNALGVPGVTNIPEKQIQLIKDFDLYVAFDNDDAGKDAMQRFVKLINKPIKAIKLKKHKDITELINERNGRKTI